MKNYFVLAAFIIFTNCASIQVYEKENHIEIVDKLATKVLGEQYARHENNRGSHYLVFKKNVKHQELTDTVAFFIYDKSSQDIIFKDELEAGTVAWASDIEVIAVARNLSQQKLTEKSSTKAYYYDVVSQKKKENVSLK